ncbi:MAG TPA: hypothetical protein VNI53_03665, partial [Gammaproteobacteria bacterium]|nr:hypothetical protein [Gammaproteobacteria bacterium]
MDFKFMHVGIHRYYILHYLMGCHTGLWGTQVHMIAGKTRPSKWQLLADRIHKDWNGYRLRTKDIIRFSAHFIQFKSRPIWYEPEAGAYFQRGMSLKARVWVDHSPHGDRHARTGTENGGAA